MIKCNAAKNQILLSYEDEDEKWHIVDQPLSQLTASSLSPGFEGTLDGKLIRYRVVANFGGDSDHHVELGTRFPPIPPPAPESRLPRLIFNTQVRLGKVLSFHASKRRSLDYPTPFYLHRF